MTAIAMGDMKNDAPRLKPQANTGPPHRWNN